MSTRSERRCLVTSAVVHGGLLVALALLSAFAPVTPPSTPQPYVILMPTQAQLTAGPSLGGAPPGGAPGETQPPPPADPPRGDPTPKLPPPATPTPPPPAKKVPTPAPAEPAKTPPPVAQRNHAAPPSRVVPTPQNKPQDTDSSRTTSKRIEVSPTVVRTTPQDRKKLELAEKAAREAEARETAAREAREAREAEAREADRLAKAEARQRAAWERAERERREAVSDAVSGLGKSLAGNTKIEIPGPGGNGPVVINYVDHVQQVFQAAWNRNRPATLAAKSARSRVALTIRRDGSFTYKVLSNARIGEVDAAINRILSQQRRLNPFPADLKIEELEVVITFNLESSTPG